MAEMSLTRSRRGIARWAVMAVTVSVVALPGAARSKDLPQAARGITVPAGFAAIEYAHVPIVPTTLTFGPDTAGFLAFGSMRTDADDHGTLLYVGGVSGNPMTCDGCGQVVAITDERTLVAPGNRLAVADGLDAVLGIAFGPDRAPGYESSSTLWVVDNLENRGRVLALHDTNGDGYFETHRVVLHNIPNGRHQTNGLTVGPDGMMYLANGNATDDGLECGPPMGPRTPVGLPAPIQDGYDSALRDRSCPAPEVVPWTGSIIRVDPAWDNVDLLNDVVVDDDRAYAPDGLDDESVLVSRGYRNIFDVDFNPRIPNELWTPMNGPDEPAGSEPIYGLEIDNEQIVAQDPESGDAIFGPVIEDAGFPSCLYDPHENNFPEPGLGGHEHPGDPEPQENLNPGVAEQFGACAERVQASSFMRPRFVLKDGHEGTSGLSFERGSNFPARYDNDLFVAEWGSLWNLNGATVTGHKVLALDVAPDGSVTGRPREFMTTPLPMDITFGDNGFLYVADMTGAIYEVQHVSDALTPDVVTIDMTDGQFVPQAITIVRGQTIRWVNSDSVAHNVRAVQAVRLTDPTITSESPIQDGSEINSPGPIPPGGEWSFTFGDRAGVWHYSSTAGAEGNTMRGTIIVLPVER